MDLERIILELRSDLQRIDQAILALEHLSVSVPKGRGRPPKWMADLRGRGFRGLESKLSKRTKNPTDGKSSADGD